MEEKVKAEKQNMVRIKFIIKWKSLNCLKDIKLNSIYHINLLNYALFISFLQNHFCIFITFRAHWSWGQLITPKEVNQPKVFSSRFYTGSSNKKEKRRHMRQDSLLNCVCFLNIHRDVAKRAHCKSLKLPEQEWLQSQQNNNNNGEQATLSAPDIVQHFFIQLSHNLI